MTSLFNAISTLLRLPFAWLFRLVIGIRHWLYDVKIFKSHKFNIPVICVGNITVGGTGKTPHTQYILDLLTQQKIKVGVLSRGYKRKTKGFLYVNIDSTAKQVGDEPLLIKRSCENQIVAVCANRVLGIKKLQYDYPDLQAVILDDGFQHRKVKAGISMVLTTYDNLATQDYLLPVGRLRDTKSQLKRAEMLIVTKCPVKVSPIDLKLKVKQIAAKPYQHLYFTRYKTKTPINIETKQEIDKKTKNIIGLAAIAQPESFFKNLMSSYNLVHALTFADHHHFTKRDLQCIETLMQHYQDAVLVTTEKDAVRLINLPISEASKKRIYYIPIEVKFLNNGESCFSKNIFNYVTKNKRISHLY
ncbi:MAG: tetraacyldisaccharide 4'-kinase [Bacteroidales bacterium]